jgi:hypothetical protein
MDLQIIDNMKKVRNIIKSTGVPLLGIDEDKLVMEIYKHVEHTRRHSYHDGYHQGKFDREMDLIHGKDKIPKFTLSHKSE